MRKVLPHLLYGSALCLLGFASFSLWRKLSFVLSSTSSEGTEKHMRELSQWQRMAESELVALSDKVRSALGRMDRAKRSEKPAQEGQEATESDPSMSPDIVRRLLVTG